MKKSRQDIIQNMTLGELVREGRRLEAKTLRPSDRATTWIGSWILRHFTDNKPGMTVDEAELLEEIKQAYRDLYPSYAHREGSKPIW